MLAINVAAVALNVAEVAPAATVTVAGTVSEGLLLAIVTLDPPEGAEAFKLTVQVAVAPALRLPVLQLSDERAATLMVPLTTDGALKPSPNASASLEFDTWIVAEVVLGASVALTYATTPDAIAVSFIPVKRQVTAPAPTEQ